MAVKAGTVVAGALGLFLAVAAHTADAKDKPVRRITETGSTSDCIGVPRTPLCAAETYLACLVRGQNSLCKRVKRPVEFLPPDGSSEVYEYVVEREVTLRPEDIPEELKDRHWKQPGIVEITMSQRRCVSPPFPCQFTEWGDRHFSLKRSGKSWIVIGSASIQDEEFGPDADIDVK